MDASLSSESFLQGAKKAAHKAMDEHGRGEYDDFALQGGVAIEKLAKAVLVSKNPVYLLDMRNGNPDLLLYFGGHLELEATKVRTVGAKDAIKRLRTLGLLPPGGQLDKLIELRNGTAHASGGDEAKSLLPSLAENVALLLKEIGVSIDTFWGRWTSAVEVAIDRQQSEVERDVQIRMKQARHLWEDRFKGLPREAPLLKSHKPGFNFFFATTAIADDFDEVVSVIGTSGCPACQGAAHVTVEPDSTSPSGDALVAVALHCLWCQLHLDGPDEIAASGADLPESLELAAGVFNGSLPGPDDETWVD